MTLDIVGLLLGATLTLLILSYLLGDNPLYRLALHLFIGTLVGYSFGVALLFIWEVGTRLAGDERVLVIPLILGIWLLIKAFPRYAYAGNFSVAYLIGVGAAVALSGAITGTIIPQVGASGRNGLLVLVGTVCTLTAFTFTVWNRQGVWGHWDRVIRVMAVIGRLFLVVAFAAAFAGALTTALSLLIGRVQYLIEDIGFSVIDSLLGR